MRRLIPTAALALTAVLFTSAAVAQILNADRTTLITFSAPVSVPGVTLPAGTYTFKLLDSQVTRNVVQIFDKDRSRILATIIAIPAQRDEVSDESVVTFKETPVNAPPAVRYWYYAGERAGQEFAYPKDQATMIANASRESVLAVNSKSSDLDDMKGADISRVEPGANAEQPPAQAPAQPAPEQQPQPEPVKPSASAPAPVTPEPAQPTEPRTASPAPAPDTPPPAAERPVGTSGRVAPQPAPASAEPERLPRTASDVPLVGLIGLMALGLAVAARVLRRATS
jgi:hypothetical protein